MHVKPKGDQVSPHNCTLSKFGRNVEIDSFVDQFGHTLIDPIYKLELILMAWIVYMIYKLKLFKKQKGLRRQFSI